LRAGRDEWRARAAEHFLPTARVARSGVLTMTKIRYTAAALAVALSTGFALPAFAEDPYTFDKVFRMADKNKDSMVTKDEFLRAMGEVYDVHMKAKKNDPMMVKGNAMTRDAMKDLIADIYKGA
jgi:hypothetical protein